MSEETAQDTTVQTTPASPVAPAAPPATEDPAWLAPRLQRAQEAAQRALLEQLGVTDPAQAKAAIEAAKKAEEANKSAEQRAAEAAASLAAIKAESEKLKGIATEQAARMLGVLSPEQQAAIKSVAGDDPAAQLRAISALGPTWKPLEAVKPPPANTAPAPVAPPPMSPGSPPDHRQVYSQLANENPFVAAAYGLKHVREVYEPTKQ